MASDVDTEDVAQQTIRGTATTLTAGHLVLKHADTFALFDKLGDVNASGAGDEGLYHDDTRFLSRYVLLLQGERPLLLSSTVREDNARLTVDLTNPELTLGGCPVHHGVLHLFRTRLLHGGVCYERLHVTHHGERPVRVVLSVELDADFADIFEIRGATRPARGAREGPARIDDGVETRYAGLDGRRRSVSVTADPVPSRIDARRLDFDLELRPREVREVMLTIACRVDDRPPARLGYARAAAAAEAALDDAHRRMARVVTSNEQFNRWLSRSAADLVLMLTDTPQGRYPYAGVPWFCTEFGRDGIITALCALWIDPGIARGVLAHLAATQATEVDAAADAEPGKIIHETRRGEMAALGEVPFRRYYGSVDATPLFVVLAAQYHAVTGDLAFVRELWPSLERALSWIDEWGDRDGDGFVEYARCTTEGLVHQGWKDSHDAVFHADGSAAPAPIALCEVQGYVYAAQRGAARLADALGRRERAARLRAQARQLRERFDQAFWLKDIGTYALALDGEKRPCAVRASNAGHCLYSGIAFERRVPRVAAALMSDASFSGWGVRTLAAGQPRFNPIAYHNGSVWPHDSALVAAGLARYGRRAEAARILAALFDASMFVDLQRMPELFCGFDRRPGEGPTLYPVACAPQAWAAASVFLMLQSVLGMSIQGRQRRLSLRGAALPPFLEEVRIENLPVGDARVDVQLHRYPDDVGVNVSRRDGAVEVLVVK